VIDQRPRCVLECKNRPVKIKDIIFSASEVSDAMAGDEVSFLRSAIKEPLSGDHELCYLEIGCFRLPYSPLRVNPDQSS